MGSCSISSLGLARWRTLKRLEELLSKFRSPMKDKMLLRLDIASVVLGTLLLVSNSPLVQQAITETVFGLPETSAAPLPLSGSSNYSYVQNTDGTKAHYETVYQSFIFSGTVSAEAKHLSYTRMIGEIKEFNDNLRDDLELAGNFDDGLLIACGLVVAAMRVCVSIEGTMWLSVPST